MSDQGAAGGPPPGWYPDPEHAGQQRWWNGSRWTEHRAPSTPPQQPPGPPGSGSQPGAAWGAPPPHPQGQGWGEQGQAWGQPGQPWGAPGGYAQPRIETWLWQSIAVTVLCCMPLGVVAIVFAAQAQGAVNAGNYAEARRKADTARNFTIAAFVAGLLAIPFFLLGTM